LPCQNGYDDIKIYGSCLFLSCDSEILKLDISDPGHPEEAGVIKNLRGKEHVEFGIGKWTFSPEGDIYAIAYTGTEYEKQKTCIVKIDPDGAIKLLSVIKDLGDAEISTKTHIAALNDMLILTGAYSGTRLFSHRRRR
jgi:hypothetical protein